MIPGLGNLAATSDLVVVGRVGLITNTGGSINAEIDVNRVLQGAITDTKIRIVASLKEASPAPELNPGKLYIFFLRAFGGNEALVYRLAGDDPNVVIAFSDEALKEIQMLTNSGDET